MIRFSTISLVMFFCFQAVSAVNTIHLTISENDAISYEAAKGKRYIFSGATVRVNNGQELPVELNTRGQTCLRAPRRCLSVKPDKKVKFNNYASGEFTSFKTKKFNLVSMWEDDGYTTSQLGYTVYRNLGLFLSPTTYTELFINEKSFGLYSVVDKPKNIMKKMKASCFIRRHYWNKIEVKIPKEDTAACHDAYMSATEPSRKLKGRELYKSLSKRLNMKQYFRWLAVNALMSSGDYSDEVFFYTKKLDGDNTKFELMGWDPDGLFMAPHLSIPNIINSYYLGNSILRSMEITLEKKIDQDKVLYSKFRKELVELFETTVTEEFIKNAIAETREKITPYLDSENVMNNSMKDNLQKGVVKYSREYIENLLQAREQFLLQNRLFLIKFAKDGGRHHNESLGDIY